MRFALQNSIHPVNKTVAKKLHCAAYKAEFCNSWF